MPTNKPITVESFISDLLEIQDETRVLLIEARSVKSWLPALETVNVSYWHQSRSMGKIIKYLESRVQYLEEKTKAMREIVGNKRLEKAFETAMKILKEE